MRSINTLDTLEQTALRTLKTCRRHAAHAGTIVDDGNGSGLKIKQIAYLQEILQWELRILKNAVQNKKKQLEEKGQN